jgi:sterol desaturase/sphingolipid hydroxylase (fatty acid hydroxylase superfamily)
MALLEHFRGFPKVVAFTMSLFVVIYLIERAHGESPQRYLSRGFLHDLGYWFYDRSGVPQLLLTAVALYVLSPVFGFLRLSLLEHLPIVARYFVYWIVVDFTAYWIHRWKHASPWLWAFHSVHHSQERLTFTTITRGHPFEGLFGSVLGFFPVIILGAPPAAWLPFQLLRSFLEAIQHSAIPWRMGPLYRVIVSPIFHSFHHSTNPEHHHRNFGVNLAIWDFLFNTAVDHEPRPAEFGLKDVRMPTIASQLFDPFRILYRSYAEKPDMTSDFTVPDRPLLVRPVDKTE